MTNMTARPNCMWCGKPLAKYTTNIYFGPGGSGDGKPYPTTPEEVQRRTNQQVTSIHWSYGTKPDPKNPYETVTDRTKREAWRAGIWDGESWGFDRQGFFCTLGCAAAYGTKIAKRVKEKS